MNIKFQTKKYPELELDLSVKPKLFGMNIQLIIDGEVIPPIDKKKHIYSVLHKTTHFDVQITSTPYDSKVVINGEKFDLTPKMEWYNYIVGGLPFVLMVSGGALAAVLGFLGWSVNMNYLRFEEGIRKYLSVLGITIVTGFIYFIVAAILQSFFG